MLNITQGIHRFMEKEVCTVENKEEIKIVNDQTIVFVWPKYFVGSSASVWSSEYMKMRWSECLLCQARKSSHNNLFDLVFVKANVDSTEEQDVMKLTENEKVELFKLLDSVKELKACTERVIISLCNGDCKQDIWEKEKEHLCMANAALLLLTNICH